ncbi:MAG: tetratricopeptide repeat protein, partial [Planctomycetia bacterium]
NFQKAVEDFSKAIELDPNCVEAFHRRAAATFNLGKYAESLPDFDKAVNLAPANAEIRRNRALPLMHLRQFDKAIEDLEIAIQAEPSTAVQSNKLLSSIYYAKAYDLETRQKYADALEESSRAVLLNPSPMNYQQRGILYYKLMQYQKSVDDLTEAIKQAPEVPWHYEKRALSY